MRLSSGFCEVGLEGRSGLQDGPEDASDRQAAGGFKIVGLTWIVERSTAWLNRNRRLVKDYEYRVQSSQTILNIAAICLILKRLAPA